MSNTFTEPTWDTYPQYVNPDPSPLADPDTFFIAATGAILQVLRYLFSTTNNLINSQLHEFLWTNSPKDTKLRIMMVYDDNDPRSDTPALLVAPAPVEKVPETDILRHGIHVQTSPTQVLRGDKRYWSYIQAACGIMCRASRGGTSRALAEEVFRFLMFFAPILKQDLGLAAFDVRKAEGPVKQTQDNTTRWVTVVTVHWMHSKSWTLPSETVY